MPMKREKNFTFDYSAPADDNSSNIHWDKLLVVDTHFFVTNGHKYFFYSVLFIHLSPNN